MRPRSSLLRRKILAVVVCLANVAPGPARADDGVVQVHTVLPANGAAPALVDAFGTAAPALDGGMVLSLQQDGRVLSIAVTPGERVRAGQTLIGFGGSAITASAYEQARTALTLAQSQRKHAAELLAQQLATRDQLAQADKAVSDARATLDALTRQGFGASMRTLTAPFDAIVAAVPVATGDRVQPGAPLVTLTRLDGLVVTVGIEPAARARVRPGAPARLEPINGGPAIQGRVVRVDAVLNPRTRLVDTDIAVPGGSVLSGDAFTAAITVGTLSGWKLPHAAVLVDAKGAYVFQVDDTPGKGARAQRVDVTLLGEAGPDDIVSGPIVAARRLVVQGNYQLDDGAALHEAAAP